MYDALMAYYASKMDSDDRVSSYRISVPIETDELPTSYTTDFIVITGDGVMTAVECVSEKNLKRRKYIKELSLSYAYWSAMGYRWKMVIGKTEKTEGEGES